MRTPQLRDWKFAHDHTSGCVLKPERIRFQIGISSFVVHSSKLEIASSISRVPSVYQMNSCTRCGGVKFEPHLLLLSLSRRSSQKPNELASGYHQSSSWPIHYYNDSRPRSTCRILPQYIPLKTLNFKLLYCGVQSDMEGATSPCSISITSKRLNQLKINNPP